MTDVDWLDEQQSEADYWHEVEQARRDWLGDMYDEDTETEVTP